VKKPPKHLAKHSEQDEENEFKFGPFPLKIAYDFNDPTNHEIFPDQILNTPSSSQQTFDNDPNYHQRHPGHVENFRLYALTHSLRGWPESCPKGR